MKQANRDFIVLIVDDDEITAEILAHNVEAEYAVMLAKSGEQALEILTHNNIDLILLDIEMPDIDGFEVCRKLKNDEHTKSIPIIFTTSYSDTETEIKGLQLGASDYLTKPYVFPLVLARIAIQAELRKKTLLLEELAHLDGLTDIPNRRSFDLRFDEEWRRATRKNSCLSLCIIDVDFFKQYNDHYGHAQGDKCLKIIAATLADSIRRSGDFIARFGGEEFILLLPNTDGTLAEQFAEKIRKKIESKRIKHEYSACSDKVTVSLGVMTVTPSLEMDRHAIVHEADLNLYKAKRLGRNKVCSAAQ